MRTVQSDSNNISLFSFHLLLNIMQRCRTIKLSDYQAVGLSIHTEEKWRTECLGLRSVRNGGSRFHSGAVFVIRESGDLRQLMVI